MFGLDEKPDRRKDLKTGFFWKSEIMPALAAGRGLNQDVSGESFHRQELEELAGGPTKYGVTIDDAAILEAITHNRQPAVAVIFGNLRVGNIPREDAPDLHAELKHVSVDGRASVKGRIQAGFEGGDYQVKLSLSRPLKVRTE